jgi:Asp-tRNA(Asn)/Glu-tRNA(Gln) amidotransferase A subunit family amidase
LKPTFGRVSRAGVTLFAASLDHVGPVARSVGDLAAAFDAIQGPDAADAAASSRPHAWCSPALGEDSRGLRIAIVGGHFERYASAEALDAAERVARALGATRRVELPEVARARAAATLITTGEAANVHLADLRARAADFDPMIRDRILAGALVPAAAYLQAQRFRAWYRAQAAQVWRDADVLVAPTTPGPALPIGAPPTIVVDGVEVLARSHIGAFTQPLSFLGWPVIAAPVAEAGPLPLGVQLVAPPWREQDLFRVAHRLEADGVLAAPIAGGT